MRFQRLDLIKFGKFSERSIELPPAEYDFHLIIGANEAGKSTLRTAIIDLLFGIPTRSPLGFLHPLSELRLGACISHGADNLEFHRAKATKQTLRSPSDAVLPDNALVPFLGSADRHFFEQMFGLDHTSLVKGGNSILDAKTDVGQILFQSAAGIVSLGKTRDDLTAEADKLWAPKKSATRAYYIANEQLDQANKALKDATVRTKSWVEISTKVENLTTALNNESTRYQQLQSQQTRLERIRRLAGFLIEYRELNNRLTELGEVIELPIEAANRLSIAEKELAVAQHLIDSHNQEISKIQEEIEKIQLDNAVLAIGDEITKLDNLRLQYQAYERDIGHRQAEKDTLWQQVISLASQLVWPSESEQLIAQRIPNRLLQRELRQLIVNASGINQTLRAAEQAEANKNNEIVLLTEQLQHLPMTEINPTLRVALNQAKQLIDSENNLSKQQNQLNNLQLELEALSARMGQWLCSLPELAAMPIPDQEKISRLLQERQNLLAEQKSSYLQLQNQNVELGRINLQISQFKALHHLTTYSEVLETRQARDNLWQMIKTSAEYISEHEQGFTSAISQADTLADQRAEDSGAAAELESLQHLLQREQLNLATISQRCTQLENDLQRFDQAWIDLTSKLNLKDLPLEEFSTWLIKREKLLDTAKIHQSLSQEISGSTQAIASAKLALVNALQSMQLTVDDQDNLAILCLQADTLIQKTDDNNVRRETLSEQLQAAKQQAASLQLTREQAKTEQTTWQTAWLASLTKAGLAIDSSPSTVETTLEIIGEIAEKLTKMQQIQIERIDTMNADLAAFTLAAEKLAATIDPALINAPAKQIVLALNNRLTLAHKINEEREHLLRNQLNANINIQLSEKTIQTTIASLKPLMEKASVDHYQQLAEPISRSDQQRCIVIDLEKKKSQLLAGGDGLNQSQIEAEIDAADILTLPATLAENHQQITESVAKQNELSADLAQATKLLADMGGADKAAQAEAQRQEALAKMSDVAERYIKVLTASNLLRWSIDRYRQEKQGPLLERASSIFATLTSGSFRRLVVDFEQEPMVLAGLRPDGKQVNIPGLSDGTRDQLYLALRLAALEMHLAQTQALPFIADDLFINYDDGRSKAGFSALKALSKQTQVIFLSHHEHLLTLVQDVFGQQVNVVYL